MDFHACQITRLDDEFEIAAGYISGVKCYKSKYLSF